MSGKENKVQAAINGALEVYCNAAGVELYLFPPFANQQGDGLRKYCADLVGMLNDSAVILLEIKELDYATRTLPEFRPDQHLSYLRLENLGVPIAYAYNKVHPLEYDKNPRARNWPELTLSEINRSIPSQLPNQFPAITNHETLLDWIKNVKGGDVTNLFGKIHGAIRAPSDLRNGVLVLLYGVTQKKLATLTRDQVLGVVDILSKDSHLSSSKKKKLEGILGASADVFSQFNKPVNKKPNPKKPKI